MKRSIYLLLISIIFPYCAFALTFENATRDYEAFAVVEMSEDSPKEQYYDVRQGKLISYKPIIQELKAIRWVTPNRGSLLATCNIEGLKLSDNKKIKLSGDFMSGYLCLVESM